MNAPDNQPPPQPIVTQAGRSFWGEAVKAVVAFLTAQLLLAFGLPVDDAIGWLLPGSDLGSATTWWIAAFALATAIYLCMRSLGRRPAAAT